MRSIETHREPFRQSWKLVVLVVLLVFTIAVPVSAQQPIEVQSADPPSAEQGTYDLEVTVGGDNFPSDAEVDFFVTGTTDPGGITVRNVKRQGPKTLKVKIDVDEAAQTQLKYDIEVRSRTNGRSGKGTELFGVVQKSNGPDTTPPGTPTNLVVVEEKYGSVELSFTMPADDGYDPASGPVQRCQVRGGVWGSQDCLEDWVAPGATQQCVVAALDPDTAYTLRIACIDEAENWSAEASIAVMTRPFAEFKDPSWIIEEVPVELDGLIGHAFDGGDNVVIAGMMGLWDQRSTKGKPTPIPMVIRVITGTWTGSAWSWSYEDVPGFANRLVMDPWGRPAFVGQQVPDFKSRESDISYVFHDGSGWVTELVAREPTFNGTPPGLAFDASGDPAVAWCSEGAGGGVRLARRDSSGTWSIETVSSSCLFGRFGGSQVEVIFDPAGTPALLYLDGLTETGPYEIRLAKSLGSVWFEEVVYTIPATALRPYVPSLVYDRVRGDFFTLSEGGVSSPIWHVELCERSGGSWQCGTAMLGGFFAGSISNRGRSTLLSTWAAQDGQGEQGETFFGLTTEATDATMARRLPGQPTWVLEYVDHPLEYGLYGSGRTNLEQAGPYLALTPTALPPGSPFLADSPTLTYQWNVDVSPASEYHLFFAWKTTP